MRWFPHSLAVCCGAIVLTSAAIGPLSAQSERSQQATAGPAGAEPRTPAAPAEFNGVWDYSDADSVNAANGRPERGPRSATQRRATPAQPPPVIPRVPNGGTLRVPGAPTPNTWGSGGGGGGIGAGVPAINHYILRDLQRDLMEIPETLTIRATTDAITIVDDLERELTFPSDGRKHKYQTAAAVYDARMQWDHGQYKKLITAAEGFKMSETYFLSNDRQRLFVIIRLGEERKGMPVYGVNRVYDRVDPPIASR
jgi:hypothetical protein